MLLSVNPSVLTGLTMRELLSALGAFEVVEVPKPEGDPLSWEPTRWVKYPLEDDAIASGGKPWIRPKQLRLAFTGETAMLRTV